MHHLRIAAGKNRNMKSKILLSRPTSGKAVRCHNTEHPLSTCKNLHFISTQFKQQSGQASPLHCPVSPPACDYNTTTTGQKEATEHSEGSGKVNNFYSVRLASAHNHQFTWSRLCFLVTAKSTNPRHCDIMAHLHAHKHPMPRVGATPPVALEAHACQLSDNTQATRAQRSL